MKFSSVVRAWVTWILISLVHTAQAGEIKILVRYDDYSRFSNSQLERELLSAVESLGGGTLVSVIPFPYADYPAAGTIVPARIDLGDDKIQLLRNYVAQGSAEIAVHGYNHRNNASDGRSSELSDLPAEMQRQLVGTAKAAMERSFGMSISSFVPSFNSYDSRTATALADAGYTLLSASLPSEASPGVELRFLPGGTYAQDLKSVVSAALKRRQTDVLIVVVVHAYDFVEMGERLPPFRKGSRRIGVGEMVEDLRSLKALGGVRFVSPADLQQSGEDLSSARLRDNVQLRTNLVVRYRLLPEFLNLYPLDGLHYTRETARSLRRSQVFAAALMYAAAFSLLACMTHVLASHLRSRSRRWALSTGLGVPILVLALIVKSHFQGLYMSSALALTCCLGVLAGMAFKNLRTEARRPNRPAEASSPVASAATALARVSPQDFDR